MPSFNQGKYLEKSILSVLNQDYSDYELIVLDGGSTDNSVEIIKKYSDRIAYWRSFPDEGQSAAFNEGFKMATGNFVTWLNSDDVLLPGTLRLFTQYVSKYPNCNWFLGNAFWIDKDDVIIKVGRMESWSRIFSKRGLYSPGGPTSFFKKSLLEKYGYLREDFHYSMDTELWERFISVGEKFIRINNYCWGLRMHEDAKTSAYMFRTEENKAIVDKKEQQRKAELEKRKRLYPMLVPNKMWLSLFRIRKIMDKSVYYRFSDRKLLGQVYYKI